MKPIPSLPRHRGGSWPGGIVFDSPVYTASISASGGAVLAATERIYRFAPGAARWQWGETPEGCGAVTCVAVEPRSPGKPRCMVAATIGALHFFDDEGVRTQVLPEGYGPEVHEMMWAPCAGGLDPTMCLYLNFGDRALRLMPDDGGPLRRFEGKFWPRNRDDDEPVAMASDGDRGVAYAMFDEENWQLEVWTLSDFESNSWIGRTVPAPSFFVGARLAVAGRAVAVAFSHVGGVWLTRDLKEQDLVELEPFREAEGVAEFDRGAVVTFEGASADAGLFVAAQETARCSIIARVDATGGVERIAELEVDEAPVVRLIQQMAWDDTRRTLWCAASHAGVLGSTAPGSPVPIGKGAVVRAAS
jgi:hypothetical protein